VVSAQKLAAVMVRLAPGHAHALADLLAHFTDPGHGVGTASQRYLAERWRCSRHKVRWFFHSMKVEKVMQIAAGDFSIPATCDHQKSTTYILPDSQPPKATAQGSASFPAHPQTYFIVGNHLINCNRCQEPTAHERIVFTTQENRPKLEVVLITTSFLITTSSINNQRERIVKERDQEKSAGPETTALAQTLNRYLESHHPSPGTRPRLQRTAATLEKLITRHKTNHQTVKMALQYLETINPALEAQFIIRSARELDRKYQRILLAMDRHHRTKHQPSIRSPVDTSKEPPTRYTCAKCLTIYVPGKDQTCHSCLDMAEDTKELIF
jgi:hypothetical protein